VLTAFHVVKPLHYVDGLTCELSQIYIYFAVDATSDHLLTKLASKSNVFKLKAMDRNDVDSLYGETLKYKNVDGKTGSWSTLNDFAFLQFENSKPISLGEYPLPMPPETISKITPNTHCFVCGYPGWIAKDKFVIDYGSGVTLENLENLYSSVESKTNHFEHKIISIGVCEAIDSTLGSLAHRCPTLRGTSGGLFGIIDSDGVTFAGVHVGGAKSMENNCVIPISYPPFNYAYMKAVATKDFLTKHPSVANLQIQKTLGKRKELIE